MFVRRLVQFSFWARFAIRCASATFAVLTAAVAFEWLTTAGKADLSDTQVGYVLLGLVGAGALVIGVKTLADVDVSLYRLAMIERAKQEQAK